MPDVLPLRIAVIFVRDVPDSFAVCSCVSFFLVTTSLILSLNFARNSISMASCGVRSRISLSSKTSFATKTSALPIFIGLTFPIVFSLPFQFRFAASFVFSFRKRGKREYLRPISDSRTLDKSHPHP